MLYHKTQKRKEEPFAIAYTEKAQVARRDHLTMIELRSPAISKGLVPNGEAILSGDAEFMQRTDLHPWLNAVVDTDKDGRCVAAVLNTSDEDIKIPKGLKYGTLTKTCLTSEETEFPWRICNLSRSEKNESQAKKMAQAAKDAHEKQKQSFDLGKPAAECSIQERKQWLIKQFKLDESPFLKIRKDFDNAVNVLLEFWDIFSHDGSYGKTHLLKHRIITEDVPPIKCRYRPINPALEPDLRKQLDQWLKHDVIRTGQLPMELQPRRGQKEGRSLPLVRGLAQTERHHEEGQHSHANCKRQPEPPRR